MMELSICDLLLSSSLKCHPSSRPNLVRGGVADKTSSCPPHFFPAGLGEKMDGSRIRQDEH